MRVLYFAWLRERLNRSADEFELPETVQTVGDLLAWIGEKDEAAALAFEDPRLIRAACDEELVDHSAPIAGVTTVALFPPMTGG
ncbi:molybdopterin converting factor subunit 1 [Mariluticola halotolerans]|uniref:molybdopterin converting factor subunit 1 n=1 Tax=Mariluticola halotolerans TaxID=2909283 RepID=UPI0026E2FE94|nr:molybdopterin converting factor subunit 1 [Mariluticola halotolerans]UJQ94439.1 molybdopterin converting factor subunit 1 [Mariluticola halotolerans]